MAEELTFEESIRPPFENQGAIENDPFFSADAIPRPNPEEQSYIKDKTVRNKYEGSPTYTKDLENEITDDINIPSQEEEEEKINNRDPSGWVNIFDDSVMQLYYGAKKGVGETGETFGAPEGWAGYSPDPEGVRQSLLQGLGQYGTIFIPANMGMQAAARAIPIGAKITSLFKKSSRLKIVQRYMAAMTAGAATDAVAFDYTDPNAVNFLMGITGISEHSTTGVFLNKWLATNPDDLEAWARAKSAFTGALTGALFDSTFRLLGFGYKFSSRKLEEMREQLAEADIDESRDILSKNLQQQFEKETGVSVEEFEEAVEELAQDIGESVDSTTSTLKLEQRQELTKSLPDDLEQSTIKEADQIADDAVEPLARTIDEPNDELVNLLTKIANGDDLEPQEFFYIDKQGKRKPLIESFNLHKLKTSDEIRGQLQAISRVIDAKKLKHVSVNENITDLVTLLGKPKEEVVEALQRNVGNIEQAVEFVPAYKVMVHIALEQSTEAYTRLSKAVPGSSEYKELNKIARAQAANLQELTGLASQESAGAGRLLQAHKDVVNPENEIKRAKADLLNTLFEQSEVATIKKASRISRLKTVSDSKLAEFKVNIQGSKRTVKVDPKKTRKARQTATKVDQTEKRILRLEKQLADIKAGKPLPKKIKREKTARELELEDLIKAEKDKLKLPEEQLALRKRHLKLSNRIKKLKEDQKTASSTDAKLKTTEISELEDEVKRLKKRFKVPKTDEQKSQTNIKRLNEELNNLILKRDLPSPKTPRELTALEKELALEIKNQKKRLGLLKSKRITEDDLRELALSEARKEEVDAINNANLTQLRNRIKASRISGVGKARDVALEIYINGLLSSFKTAQINAFGNTYAIGSSIIERFMAARKGGGPISNREAAIYAYNSLAGIPEAWKLFRTALKHGPSDSAVKTDFFRQYDRNISAEMFQQNGNFGKALDIIGNFVNLPGKVVMSMDEAFKGLSNRMEYPALAYRKAVKEFGKTPKTTAEITTVNNRANQIFEEIDLHEDILEEASMRARKATYTNPLGDVEVMDAMGKKSRVSGLTKLIKTGLDRDRTGILRVFLPFFQTPVNLMKESVSRLPFRLGSRLLQDELSSPNPAIRQLAEAKLATGKWIYGGAFMLGWNGQITDGPPADPKLRVQMETAMGGPHWNSFNMGFGWQSYNRLDPIGMVLSTGAQLAQIGKSIVHLNQQSEDGGNDDLIYKKYEELALAATINMTRLITDRHYLQGLTDLMGVFSTDLHEKRKWIKRLSSVNPVVSFYSSFRRGVTRGLEGTKMEKLQPIVPQGETPFDKLAYKTTGELVRFFDDTMRDVTPGYGVKRPSRTIMGNIKMHPASHFSDHLNKRPTEIITNLAQNMFNPVPPLIPSGDPVELKLAELESNIKAPSNLYSIPLGTESGTRRSYGVLRLNDEQKEYLQDEWIKLNTSGGLTRMVQRWNRMGKKAPSPEIQKNTLERVLKAHLRIAEQKTIGKFKDLLNRRTHIIKSKGKGLSNPVMPTTGLLNNILPQPQGQQ